MIFFAWWSYWRPFGKTADENASGTEPLLRHGNCFKIRSRLGGIDEHTARAHTHTHRTQKVSRMYPQWTFTTQEWLCGNKSDVSQLNAPWPQAGNNVKISQCAVQNIFSILRFLSLGIKPGLTIQLLVGT